MLHSGVLVEHLEARAQNLRQVLGKYIEKKFTGYILYKTDDTQLVIGMINGNIALCRLVKYIPVVLGSVFGETRRKTVLDGVDCCDNVTGMLDQRVGIIDVYSVDPKTFVVNALAIPQARVETSVRLAEMFRTGVGIPIPLVKPVVAPAKPPEVAVPPRPEAPSPPKPPEPRPMPEAVVKPPVKPEAPAIPPPPPRVEVKRFEPAEIVVNECIDPLTLYSVIKSSTLEETHEALVLKDLLEKMRGLHEQKKPNVIYARGILEDATVKVLFNAQTGTANIEIERRETHICGKDAINTIKDKPIRDIRIWSSK